jgi:hypothetical protein
MTGLLLIRATGDVNERRSLVVATVWPKSAICEAASGIAFKTCVLYALSKEVGEATAATDMSENG